MSKLIRLGVNIDHVATLRNARGGTHPDPVDAARLAIGSGADGITAHLREDRRHINDQDLKRLQALCLETGIPLNMEMAATDEMCAIAHELKPHAVCIVPERREERTTEGGLNVVGGQAVLAPMISKLTQMGSRVSLFIEADPKQIQMAAQLGAPVIEIHTGAYAHALDDGELQTAKIILESIKTGAKFAHSLGLEVHAGHGLTFDNVGGIAEIPEVRELNIGHFLIGESVFIGMKAVIQKMRVCIDKARIKGAQ